MDDPRAGRRLGDRFDGLLDRHGDDLLDETKRFIRRLRRTVAIVGAVIAVGVVVVVGLVGYAIMHAASR